MILLFYLPLASKVFLVIYLGYLILFVFIKTTDLVLYCWSNIFEYSQIYFMDSLEIIQFELVSSECNPKKFYLFVEDVPRSAPNPSDLQETSSPSRPRSPLYGESNKKYFSHMRREEFSFQRYLCAWESDGCKAIRFEKDLIKTKLQPKAFSELKRSH